VIPEDRKYTKEHEWVEVKRDGDTVRVGITDYAQEQLGDVVFVQLPPLGETTGRGDALGEVESTKSVSDIYAPVTGEVVAVNDALSDSQELINSDPYGAGWMVELRLDDPDELDELLDADDYLEVVNEA
jgi:glycine cleavage system H protein